MSETDDLIRRLGDDLAEARRQRDDWIREAYRLGIVAEKWVMMERPYIGGYEKGPNPSYLCRHRYRLLDCITCLNEHLAASDKSP